MSPGIKSRLLATQSDERLVALVHAGHEPAFEALVHRYRKPLLRYCRRFGLSETRAEEVLQQTLMNAWVALRRDCEIREVRAWLYRIAHNAALNAIRADHATAASAISAGELYGDEQATAVTVAGAPSLDQVLALRDAWAGMAELPQMQREVIVRTAVGGHSHTEVASALGITADAVRGLLYRARATLRQGVTAVTPAPVLAWAAGAGGAPTSGSERFAELAAGGTAGLTGLAVKGAVVAITAGVAITGSVIAHDRKTLGRPPAAVLGMGLAATAGSEAQASSLLFEQTVRPHAPLTAGAKRRRTAPEAPTASLPASRLHPGLPAPSHRHQPTSVTLPGLRGGETHEVDTSASGDQRHEPTGIQPTAGGGAPRTPAEGEGGEEHGAKQPHGQAEERSKQKGDQKAQREGGLGAGGGQEPQHGSGQGSEHGGEQDLHHEAPGHDGGQELGEHNSSEEPPSGGGQGRHGQGEPKPRGHGVE